MATNRAEDLDERVAAGSVTALSDISESGSLNNRVSDLNYNDNDHQYEVQINGRPIRHNNIAVPAYEEPTVTVMDYGKSVFNNPVDKSKHYFKSLFPIAQWILHYNYKWASSDLIAGITVGVVLVPQSMSYASLAGLPPEYGLYSSFVGVFIYSFFATSKDVSIGPVAVMSMQVGKVIANVQEKAGDRYSGPEIATFLALICGGIAAGMGILRIGFILEFISIPAVMGFMTGSAFSILTGQIPGLMGYLGLVNTREATYQVVINTLKHLPDTTVDAAFGLVSLFILYAWKILTEVGQKRSKRFRIWFFFIQQLRNAIVLIFATLISWAVVHPELKKFSGETNEFNPSLKILGVVPAGLRHTGVMTIPDGIIEYMASEIPVSTIILLLEHIAIAKSFGRVNDYKIVPDQELIAIGVNNLIGTFFSAYPSTGSFSRSALKNKCGVKTPFAGIFTGAVVLLALYVLTDAFYYIPKATLSAVIIHAVSDLIASYKTTWNFWKTSPIDAGIFVIAVFITVFSSIENGIYFAICASAAVLLFRVAIPNGQFLGKIKVAEVVNPVIVGNKDGHEKSANIETPGTDSSSANDLEIYQVLSNDNENNNNTYNKSAVDTTFEDKRYSKKQNLDYYEFTTKNLLSKNPEVKFHTKWVPMDNKNINKELNVQPPPPGVVVFKPMESFTYPNCSLQLDRILDHVRVHTKRGVARAFSDTGSRPWNDPGPLKWNLPFLKKFNREDDDDDDDKVDTRPILKIMHFDFSCVSSIDATSIQSLVDLRKSLNNYAGREVEFHFSSILSPWIRRGLLNAGFGTYAGDILVSDTSYVNVATKDDLELGRASNDYYAAVGTNTPFFHLDIPDYQ